MARRFLVTVALVVCAFVSAWGVERATLVMTNGERKSGTVVFHGSQGNNVIDDQFNLGFDGKEQGYPVSQVAAIEFVGGQPSANELQMLAMDVSNMLVLRNGQLESGRFVNLVNGQTVAWKNAAGMQVNIPIADVSRIYLNIANARLVHGVVTTPAQSAAVGTSGQVVRSGIRVDGNTQWVATGLAVVRGQRLAFNATGHINVAEGASAGPAGTDVLHGDYPVDTVGAGGLIARVGNGKPFAVGSISQEIVMPATGQLRLGINDDHFPDNTGYFTVSIARQ